MEAGLKLVREEDLQPVRSLPPKGSQRLLLEIGGTMIPAILAPVFAAGFYEVEEAGSAWSRCALKAGWSIDTPAHAVIDGAQWIRSQHQTRFGKFGRALCDCFHLCEYLAAAFPDKETCRLNKARLLEERIDPILQDLAGQAAQEDPQEKDRPAADAL